MERMLRYVDFYKNFEYMRYEIFEVDFQKDLFECGLADINWAETFKKYGIKPVLIGDNFETEDITKANIELIGAMMTYIHRGVTHWSQSSLLEYRDFFIASLLRLQELLNSNKTCHACNKEIDGDSSFCKYCGEKVALNWEPAEEEQKLVQIFEGVYQSLYINSRLTKDAFDQYFDKYKGYQGMQLTDDDYYIKLVEVIFYSGFRASTVDRFLHKIHSYFGDYRLVAEYDNEKLDCIMSDQNMIKNKSKIEACIFNASKFAKIVETYGSFNKYIESFNADSNDEELYKLKKSLEKNFKFLGGITSYHFMTDIGLNVLKPDRVVQRIFFRLGLIDDEKDYRNSINMGRLFSSATNLPIRYIDIIFVSYGQLNLNNLECICSEKNPKCLKCGANIYCNYYRQNKTDD